MTMQSTRLSRQLSRLQVADCTRRQHNVLLAFGKGTSRADASVAGVSFLLRVTGSCGRVVDVNPAFTLTGVESSDVVAFSLQGSTPNPVQSRAEIRYTLDMPGDVTLVLYDVLGREVARLVEGAREAGPHEARVEASSVPSGIYVYRLSSQGRTLTVAR